jgi:hypothetical protein
MLQVGDFIAIANLTAKTCRTLSSSQGSKPQFASLLAVLNTVGQTMIHAEAACMEYHTSALSDTTPDDPKDALRLEQIADEIVKQRNDFKAVISSFLSRFKSYESVFMKDRQGIIKHGYKSIAFQFRKDEIATFEKELQTHLQSMQMLLNSFF